jgi:dolichol kinase
MWGEKGRVSGMMKSLLTPRKLLAQTIAAVAIAVFWCISAVGTTVGTTVGVTTLATAVTAATSTPAEAGWRRRRYRRHRRRWRGGRWWWW